ncbi:hypothetical protein SAMN05421857_4082 [Chryseobacterium formosense]|nr:hypothetical protein SAMN05421857_4082 [Chryseobacterium formosense]
MIKKGFNKADLFEGAHWVLDALKDDSLKKDLAFF